MGQVRHHRLRPAVNRFAYPTWFLLLPLRQLRTQPCAALRRNRWGWVSFHDRDHGDGRGDCLAWLDHTLADHGLRAEGEVWLQTYPRLLGFTFKPVSFWFCHGANGALVAIVAEVNNTFGERHTYVLHGPELGWGRPLQASKALHVSPFCQVEGGYEFRFLVTGLSTGADTPPPASPPPRHGNETNEAPPRCVARIDYHDPQGLLISTSVSGTLSALTSGSLRRALWRMPWLTLGVVARIHWQALKLLLKGVPFHGKRGQAEPAATAAS